MAPDPVGSMLNALQGASPAGAPQGALTPELVAGALAPQANTQLAMMNDPLSQITGTSGVSGLGGGGVAANENAANNVVGFQTGARNAAIAAQNAARTKNLQSVFSQGGQILHELPNGYSVGRVPASNSALSGADHVLLSPRGNPVLYGRSPKDLVRRGFPDDEIPPLLKAITQ